MPLEFLLLPSMQLKLLLFLAFYHCMGEVFPILWLKVCICLMRPAFLNGLTGFLSIHVNAKVVGCATKYFRYVEVMWSEMRMNPLFSIHLMDYRILCSPTFCFFFGYLSLLLFSCDLVYPLVSLPPALSACLILWPTLSSWIKTFVEHLNAR